MESKGSIAFIFGGIRPFVNGGTKVVLEYANRLSRLGWQVRLVFSMSGDGDKTFIEQIHFLLYQLKLIVKYGISVRNWFDLDKCVDEVYVKSLDYTDVPLSDVYVATYVSTAPFLNSYPIEAKRKFYFIQDYEIWGDNWTDDRTKETYHFDMTKLVISKWLHQLLSHEGVESIIVPNGFDFDYFKMTVPFENKDKYSITILYNENPHKGVKYALEAIQQVKEKYAQLKVNLFGTYTQRPKCLPRWMNYYSCPNQELHNKLYNNSAIYVAASTYEGWGLTIGEAMMCGCAIACTDTDGFKEMVKDGETGLMSPVGDIVSLSNNICRLIENDVLRMRIARAGYNSIRHFSWDNSVKIFSDAIEGGSE